AEIAATLRAALAGHDAIWLMDGRSRTAVPIRLRLPAADQAGLDHLLALRVRGTGGALVPLSEIVRVQDGARQHAVFRKDLLPYAWVSADDAGASDSPLYGMFAMVSKLGRETVAGQRLEQRFIEQPSRPVGYAVKWDG